MLYNQPFDKPPEVTYGDTPYINGNPSTGQQGSIPSAASIEFPQREIVNLIRDAGAVTASNSDLHQLARSVQSGGLCMGVEQASSAADHYVVALIPAPSSYRDGMLIWFRSQFANTGVCTLDAGGGVNSIVRRGGGLPLANDIVPGANTMVSFNASTTNWELINISGSGTGNQPQVLTANLDLYVNPVTGNDNLYDGTSATVVAGTTHGPFQHIQYAVNYIFANYLPSSFRVFVHLSAGTFVEATAWPSFPGPTIEIIGNGRTSSFVNGANGANTFHVVSANTASIHDLCVQSGTGAGPPVGFFAGAGSSLTTFNTASNACAYAVWSVYGPGKIIVGTHTFNAATQQYLFAALFGGFIALAQNATYTLGGNQNLGPGATAFAFGNGSMQVPQSPQRPTWTGGGVVTGSKYNCQANGVIDSQGAGTGYFPGSIAGSLATGGQYT